MTSARLGKIASAAFVLLFVCATGARAASPRPEIGTTVIVKNQVMVEFEEEKRRLAKGSKVHQNETLETSTSASAEIQLLDDTKLAVGPSARIVLDKFIYDPNAAPGTIAINLSKGAFRFITGTSPSSAYEITTPTATLGVRGTVFDVFVADDGETAVLLHQGAVDVCSSPGSCRRHDQIGRFVHVSLQRVISVRLLWDGTFMRGRTILTAFPFVGKQLAIDSVRRLSHAALLGKAVRGKATDITTKSIPGTGGGKLPGGIDRALPKVRLPF